MTRGRKKRPSGSEWGGTADFDHWGNTLAEVRTSMRSRIGWTVLVLVAALIAIALTQFNLSAQQEPGPVETVISNRAKRFFIRRASRHAIPIRPVDLKTSIENGGSYYGLECSICHGDDGVGEGSRDNGSILARLI